jgi:hypothetical protein
MNKKEMIKMLDKLARSIPVVINANTTMHTSAGKPAGNAAVERFDKHMAIINEEYAKIRAALETEV